MDGPGVGQPAIPSIDKLAKAYVSARDRRLKAKETEDVVLGELASEVHEHQEKLGFNQKGEINYRFDDFIITVKPGKEKVKVARFAEAVAEEPAE